MSIHLDRLPGSPLYQIRSSYFSPALNESAKAVPGWAFDPAARAWRGYRDWAVAVIARLSLKGIRVGGLEVLGDGGIPSHTPFLFSTKNLRPYQIEGVRFLIARSSDGCLLADGMRLGKSLQSLIAARAFKQKALIVCPPHIVGVWSRPPEHAAPGEIAKWWPDAFWEGNPIGGVRVLEGLGKGEDLRTEFGSEPLVVVCHYDILYAWKDRILAWGPRTLIADECFPAGTQVDTPDGPQGIETIEVGASVLNAFGRGAVSAVSRRIVFIDDLVLVRLDDGREIVATANHPMLTPNGWRSLGDLRGGDALVDLTSVHMLTRCDGVYPRLLSKHEGEMVVQEVSSVQGDEENLSSEAMLLEILRGEIQVGADGLQRETGGFSRHPRILGAYETEHAPSEPTASGVGRGIERSDEKAQPGPCAWGKRANAGDKTPERDSACAASSPWRQRQTESEAGKNPRAGIRPTVDPHAGGDKQEGARTADIIRDRSSPPRADDCSRSRRAEPLLEKRRRSPQRSVLATARVASVTVPKPTDLERLGLGRPDDQGRVRVYNLQVEGHPSYGVNGLLAHNCHIISGYDSRRARSLKEIRENVSRCMGLTGTPVTNTPNKLHNVLDIISPGRFGYFFLSDKEGVQRASYARVFCASYEKTVGKGEGTKRVWDHSGKSNIDSIDNSWALTKEETLKERLGSFMLRRLKKDVDPELPTKERQIVDVSIPARRMVGLSGFAAAGGVGSKAAVEMRRILDLAADGKLNPVRDILIEDLGAEVKGLCFCYRRAFTEALAGEIEKKAPEGSLVEWVHGGLTQRERDKRIEKVRGWEGPALLIATIDTTSTGIDLSFASVATFAELSYEPVDLLQAEERLYRFGAGQKSLIRYVIARGTGDELVLSAVIAKLDTFERAVGSTGERIREDLGRTREGGLARLYEALKKSQEGSKKKGVRA